MNKKTVALLMACVLLVGAAIGGTMAWLVDDTDPVTNVFTVGDINITLSETEAVKNEETGAYEKGYHFVPGDTLSKDPKVTVLKDSEPCWLFIKVVENNNITVTGKGSAGEDISEKALKYSIAGGWTQYEENSPYWYRSINQKVTAENGESFQVLNNDQVVVSTYVTKDHVSSMGANGNAKPTITFKAAAVQKAHINTVGAAFDELPADFLN